MTSFSSATRFANTLRLCMRNFVEHRQHFTGNLNKVVFMWRLYRVLKGTAIFTGISLGSLYAVCEYTDSTALGFIRFGRAAITIGDIVLDYRRNLFSLKGLEEEEYLRIKSAVHLRSAIHLRELCCRNGGCFIKVGQHLGSLNYLLPIEYTDTLKVLHTNAPESPLEEIFEVIEEELGRPVHELFNAFDKEPLGTASLAQVHRAELKDGRIVAVKVQRKYVKPHAWVDMATMELLVRVVARIFPDFQFLWLAEETKKNLPRELDFVNEGRLTEDAASRFTFKFPFLKIPEVFWDYTTDRVLTMEYMEGGKINDRQYYADNKLSVNDVSSKLGQLYSEMIFVQGVVHCDPHPGNILVRPNKVSGAAELVLLDHGLYQTLTDQFRLSYCRLWRAMIEGNENTIVDESQNLGCDDRLGRLLACMVSGRSWAAISSGQVSKKALDAEESQEIASNVGNFVSEIVQVLNRVPRQMLLLFKTNDLLRGIEATLRSSAVHTLSLVVMARCCLRALLDSSDGSYATRFGRFVGRWHLFKLTVYQWYLSTILQT